MDNIKHYIHDDKVTLYLNNNENVNISLNEFANWISLIECLETISQHVKKISKHSNQILKPLIIEKYIREKSDYFYNHLQTL